MISLSILFLWVAATSELQVGATSDSPDTTTDSSQLTTPARMIETPRPIFPASGLAQGNEAWVHITYCVDESGSPQNVSVLDSVGGSSFESAAVQSVKQWKFEPALVNGKPSWQSRTKTTINFAIDDENDGSRKRASRKFSDQFRKLGRLIKNDELEEADELFWTIVETSSLSLYEHSNLWAERARYELAVEDLNRVDLALRRATVSNGKWIEPEVYVELLKLRVDVELIIGQYDAAIGAFDELTRTSGKDSEAVLSRQPTFERLQSIIDSDDAVSVKAEIKAKGGCNNCNNSWYSTLVRNAFTFVNVEGKLESIEMRCDHKRFESIVSELIEWHIPDDWGTCDVQVYGDPGTTFDLLLLPTT